MNYLKGFHLAVLLRGGFHRKVRGVLSPQPQHGQLLEDVAQGVAVARLLLQESVELEEERVRQAGELSRRNGWHLFITTPAAIYRGLKV